MRGKLGGSQHEAPVLGSPRKEAPCCWVPLPPALKGKSKEPLTACPRSLTHRSATGRWCLSFWQLEAGTLTLCQMVAKHLVPGSTCHQCLVDGLKRHD